MYPAAKQPRRGTSGCLTARSGASIRRVRGRMILCDCVHCPQSCLLRAPPLDPVLPEATPCRGLLPCGLRGGLDQNLLWFKRQSSPLVQERASTRRRPPYIYNPARVTHDCWGRIAENHQACCQKKRAFGYTKMHRVYKNRSRNMEQHGFIESVNGRWL